MVTEIKNLIISEDTPGLPSGWEGYVLWLRPSTGIWRYWNGTDWVVASAPLIVVPTEVALDTELDARMLAHEALPSVHHTAFTQTEHDALPNPHHSNSLDHNGTTQDTAIAGKTTLVEVKADADVADAITKKHTQGTDTNDHSHANKALLDTYAQTEVNLADAVTKKHTQNADTDLDATFEATFEKIANKGAVSGYAELDVGSKVPVAQLGTGTPDGTKYLRDDRSWVTPAGGGGGLSQILITLWQDAALTAWTNMPAAETEFRNVLNTRTKLDLTTATQSRVIARVGVAPAANAKIKVQYSTDESTWVDLCSVTMPATANKTNVGTWTAVPAGAKADVFLRVVGVDGNGTADPSFGLISLGVK